MGRLNIRMDAQIAILAVVEKGSFAAAGKYLGVTKSAARKQVSSIDIDASNKSLERPSRPD